MGWTGICAHINMYSNMRGRRGEEGIVLTFSIIAYLLVFFTRASSHHSPSCRCPHALFPSAYKSKHTVKSTSHSPNFLTSYHNRHRPRPTTSRPSAVTASHRSSTAASSPPRPSTAPKKRLTTYASPGQKRHKVSPINPQAPPQTMVPPPAPRVRIVIDLTEDTPEPEEIPSQPSADEPLSDPPSSPLSASSSAGDNSPPSPDRPLRPRCLLSPSPSLSPLPSLQPSPASLPDDNHLADLTPPPELNLFRMSTVPVPVDNIHELCDVIPFEGMEGLPE